MLIQIFLSLFIIFALVKVGGRFKEREISHGSLFFWCVFWLVVAVVVWRPQFATETANLLGVGRGADLVLYISVAVLFYLVFRLTVKLEKIDRNITQIVRKSAIKNTEEFK